MASSHLVTWVVLLSVASLQQSFAQLSVDTCPAPVQAANVNFTAIQETCSPSGVLTKQLCDSCRCTLFGSILPSLKSGGLLTAADSSGASTGTVVLATPYNGTVFASCLLGFATELDNNGISSSALTTLLSNCERQYAGSTCVDAMVAEAVGIAQPLPPSSDNIQDNVPPAAPSSASHSALLNTILPACLAGAAALLMLVLC